MITRRALLAAPALLSAKSEQPDIVVVLCDDLGYGDLGCFGHPNISTPNLDKFATQGIRFTDCYAAAPVCSPSRCGLLTGRTPTRLGVYDWIPEGSAIHLQRSEQTFQSLTRFAPYHLPTDLGEKTDLSAQNPKQLLKLKTRLLSLHKEVLSA